MKLEFCKQRRGRQPNPKGLSGAGKPHSETIACLRNHVGGERLKD